jgi:hypothetical protein
MADASSRCAYCGKAAHKDTDRVSNPHWGSDALRAAWQYSGNLQVIRRDWHTVDGQRKWVSAVFVWDGESWRLDYDPFCRLECARLFACAAHRAGYRIINNGSSEP